MEPLRLAVDFDNTLMDTKNVLKGYKMGQAMPGATEAMNKLKAGGAIIVIHSIWADTEAKQKAMSDWLHYFNIPYDFITNIKPDCDIFLDDKAIRFSNWNQALTDISKYRP